MFSPFSIAITSLGEERANLSAFRTFVRFVLVWICRFPLPLGVWEGLRFVIVALPGLFSYFFFRSDSITSLKLASIMYHRSIAFNITNLIPFLREKVNAEIGYNSKRGRDRINLPSMTSTGIYDPFRVIDLLS